MSDTPKPNKQGLKVAYVVSRFPKITETFILREMVALREQGIDIELFPLVLEKTETMHKEAVAFKEAAHRSSLLSPKTIAAQFFWLFHKPGTYLALWFEVLFGHLFSLKFLLRALVAFPKAVLFAKEAAETECDHIHAHFATHGATCAYLMHKLTGIPYSFTAHAHDIYVEKPMLKRKLDSASFVATISNFNKNYLKSFYPAVNVDKIHIVHCGVDTATYKAVDRKPEPGIAPILLCIASLEEYKGHRYLVEACRLLKSRGVPFKCLCIGGGDLEADLKDRAATCKISKEMVFLGRLPQDEVRQHLSNASLLVLPSIIARSGKMEGLPVVLMEALAMNIPVVATDISGISELVESEVTGLLVPEKNPSELAEAMERQLSHPKEGMKMAKEGRQRVLSEFDIQDNAALLADLFRQHHDERT